MDDSPHPPTRDNQIQRALVQLLSSQEAMRHAEASLAIAREGVAHARLELEALRSWETLDVAANDDSVQAEDTPSETAAPRRS
jgi:hypothetical protein